MEITVIGAGTMGRGIALAFTLAGYRTVLHDVSGRALNAATASIQAELAETVQAGTLKPDAAESALALLQSETYLPAAVQRADLLVEAVCEGAGCKQELLSTADRFAPPHTIFASNTSSLSVTELASKTKRAPRFLGMHFVNPPHKSKVVELVEGLDTSAEATDAAEAVVRCMGKETVRLRELPGSITAHISALITNEAFHLLERKAAPPEDIDRAIRLGLSLPLGPLELADRDGLDTRLRELEYLHQALGERYKPSTLLVQYVHAGRLGHKTERGVFDYRQKTPVS